MKTWSTLKARIQDRWRRSRDRPTRRDDFDSPSVTFTDRNVPSDEEDATIQQSVPTSLSFLYSLATRWAWPAVAFRCDTHPQEVLLKEQDTSGDTILHWSCFGSPPAYAVEAILEICPELAAMRNYKGFLPLHTACCYRASAGVIRALVKAFPEGAGMVVEAATEQGGSTPLHLLCDYGCHADSLRAILETEAGVKCSHKKDRIYRRTPLQILNERKNLSEFHSHLEELRRLASRNPDALVVLENGQLENYNMQTTLLLERIRNMGFWEKAQLLALAERIQQPVTTLQPTNTTVVHALITVQVCPPALLEFAGLLLPHELMRRDEHGDLPLHVAARCSSDDVICDVLRAEPKAASMPDADGAMALEIYLQRNPERTWNHVIKKLTVAFPLAIENLDLDRKLYPLIWSRLTTTTSTGRENVDALFLSIQGNPSFFDVY